MLQHFSVLYITFALALLVSSVPLHGNDKIDRAVMTSPQAMKVVSPARGNSINKTSRGIPSARTNTSTSRRSKTHFESRVTSHDHPHAPKTLPVIQPLRRPGPIPHPLPLPAQDQEPHHRALWIAFLKKLFAPDLDTAAASMEDRCINLNPELSKEIKEFQDGIELDEPGQNDEDDKSYLVKGVFPLTDSLYAAAQRACSWSMTACDPPNPRIVSVAEFQWLENGMKVKEFEMDAEFKKFRKNRGAIMEENDMISSPLEDDDEDYELVAGQFQQYAVTKQRAIDKGNLKFTKEYAVHCNAVQVGDISDIQYTQGQKTEAKIRDFEHLVRDFTSPKKETKEDRWQRFFDKFYPA